jgi:hypothetical protein
LRTLAAGTFLLCMLLAHKAARELTQISAAYTQKPAC